jgi:hypothetical protein
LNINRRGNIHGRGLNINWWIVGAGDTISNYTAYYCWTYPIIMGSNISIIIAIVSWGWCIVAAMC